MLTFAGTITVPSRLAIEGSKESYFHIKFNDFTKDYKPDTMTQTTWTQEAQDKELWYQGTNFGSGVISATGSKAEIFRANVSPWKREALRTSQD